MNTFYTVRRIGLVLMLALFVGLLGAAMQVNTTQAASTVVINQNARYTVQRGDTLYSIARRYGTTVRAIMQVNGLRTTTIYVGQSLTIPGASSPHQPVTYHVVQHGDTLSAIARRYNVSVEAIRRANGLTSNTIYVGQRLCIPNGSGHPTPVPGAGVQRIQFAPGATSATVTGTVQSPQIREYVLRAMAGQKMHIELISSDASARLGVTGVSDGTPYKRLSVGGTVFDLVLPLTQDYKISIATDTGAPVRYELYVEVLPAPGPTPMPVPGAQRIQFAPGTTSATVYGTSSTVAPARYVLRAEAGQTMVVHLEVDNSHAYITVLNPNGENMAGADGPIHDWSGPLPTSGDYGIEVINGGTGLANFALTVAVY